MPSTRPECSSGTENVNRHAEDEEPRAAVFRYVPHAIPDDEWAPVADFTRESVLLVHPGSEREAIEAMRTVSQFVVWAHRRATRWIGTECSSPTRSSATSRSLPRTWPSPNHSPSTEPAPACPETSRRQRNWPHGIRNRRLRQRRRPARPPQRRNSRPDDLRPGVSGNRIGQFREPPQSAQGGI